MTDSGQAAPGWYPDPYQPSRLRYWDGAEWTDHYHAGDGSLPDVGTWLGSTFSAIGAYGIPALGLAFGASLVLNLVTALGLRWVVGDFAVIGQEVVGDVGLLVVRATVIVLAVALAQGLVWMAMNRFMQRAHLQAEPSIGEALHRAVTRLPRMVGIYLLLGSGFVAIVALFFGLLVVVGDSPGLSFLAFLCVVPVLIWAGVKVTFISAAIVAAPASTGTIKASASVSDGRWWGVFGRVLLLSVMVGLASGALGSMLGGFGSPIDQEAFGEAFVASGDTIRVRDFSLKELLPTAADLIPYVVVSSVLNALTGLVTTSGTMRLYLDSGGPSEI